MLNKVNRSIASALPIEGADAKASVALTESLDSQRRLACEPTVGLRGSSIDWAKLLKVLIAVLTAIAGSLGVVSCIS